MPPPAKTPVNNPLLALLAEGGQTQQPQLPQMPNIPPQGQIPGPVGIPQGAPQPQQGLNPSSIPNPAQQSPGMIPNLGVRTGMGSMLSNQLSQVGAQAPTPPINPVVETFDNAPPIVREAIRRRLFTQGM